MRFHPLAVLPLLFLTACGGGNDSVTPAPTTPGRYQATSTKLLSTSSPTKDEDPFVILAKDGSIVVAWFSDRGGNSDIYIARCDKGTTWSDPVRVTVNPDGDFYPSLTQDANGMFHLTWFRWHALNRGNIWYNQSADPLVWDPANEKQVTTTPNVDDWVPCLAQTPDSLRVFFVSTARDTVHNTADIYYASSSIDSVAFGPARLFVNNSRFSNDNLPVAAWTGSQLDVVWMRYDTSQSLPWLAPKSELCYAFSNNGVDWSGEFLLTFDAGNVQHVFPALYQRSNHEWRLLWTTTRSGSPQVVELPLPQIFSYPNGLIVNNHVGAGYSHHLTRTPVNDLYFGAWVNGPDGAQDIYYRFYEN
jgi:hypothetical protein